MNKERHQIIYLWNYLEWGGPQIHFLSLIKEAGTEWDIVAIMPKQSSPGVVRLFEQEGAICEFLDYYLDSAPAETIRRKVQRQLRRIRGEVACFRLLRRYDLRKSILHAEIAPWQSWILLVALSFRGAKVFVTMNNVIPRASAWREMIWKARLRIVSRLPGFHIFTSNQYTKNDLRGRVSDRFWEDIKVTYACVNPPEIKRVAESPLERAELRRNHDIDVEKFVVLCVGQFIDRKGRWVFLESAKTVVATCPDVLFLWLTPKMADAEEQQKIAEYGLGGNFRLMLSETVGSSHTDVLNFFRVADVFALPSLFEGLPISLLEAMALGIPSISTNIHAIPEALRHLETGILIEPGDPSALAKAVLQLKEDADLRVRLAKKGSDSVLRDFDERVSARIALTAYEESLRDAN